jgi:hypothetical protein
VPPEQLGLPLFMCPHAGRAVAACHEILIFRTRHQPAQLGEDQPGLFELGIEAVRVLEHDDQALHVVAVPAVNMDQPARHRFSPLFFRPTRTARSDRRG